MSCRLEGKGRGGLGTRAGAGGVSSVKDTGAGRGTHRDLLHGTAHLRGRCGARRDDDESQRYSPAQIHESGQMESARFPKDRHGLMTG